MFVAFMYFRDVELHLNAATTPFLDISCTVAAAVTCFYVGMELEGARKTKPNTGLVRYGISSQTVCNFI